MMLFVQPLLIFQHRGKCARTKSERVGAGTLCFPSERSCDPTEIMQACRTRCSHEVHGHRLSRGGSPVKKQILVELCSTTGWHRDHARRALPQAQVIYCQPGAPSAAWSESVVERLTFCRAVQGGAVRAACRGRVGRRRFKQLGLIPGTASQLLTIATATNNQQRRPITAGSKPTRETGTAGPVSYQARKQLKGSIPMRNWEEWTDAVVGFMEIDLIGHEARSSCRAQNHGTNVEQKNWHIMKATIEPGRHPTPNPSTVLRAPGTDHRQTVD